MKKKEEGTALILVLLVVAVVTVLGVTSVDRIQFGIKAVSYTHLTLPTILLV